MKIRPITGFNNKIIKSYGGSSFNISGVIYKSSVIVVYDHVESLELTDAKYLTLEMLKSILNAKPPIEIILLGCAGGLGHIIDETLKTILRADGVVVELMETGSACRTYNLLAAEGRRVAALLIPPK